MPTFAPPVSRNVPPRVFPPDMTYERVSDRLFRRYQMEFGADCNVYILIDGSVVTETPQTLYRTAGGYGLGVYGAGAYGLGSGSAMIESLERIRRVFYGGHAPEEVNAEEQALLEAAGFTVTP